MERLRLRREEFKEFRPWFPVAAVAIGVHWVASSFHELLHGMIHTWVSHTDTPSEPSSMIPTIIFLVVVAIPFLFVAMIWLYKVRHWVFRPRTRYLLDIEHPEPREFLVLFLSNLDEKRGQYIDGIPLEFLFRMT